MNRNLIQLLCGLILGMCLLPGAYAVPIDSYSFDDPEQQARFKELSHELRCPKCLNTNLAGSNAPIAEDLRKKVYELIKEGNNDKEILEYMVSRYGDFVLYRPAFRTDTLLLWLSPIILAIIGVVAIILIVRRSQKAATAGSGLTDVEQAKLSSLLNEDNNK